MSIVLASAVAPSPAAARDTLYPGQLLAGWNNEALWSDNGLYEFIMQSDGNAVIYRHQWSWGPRAYYCWHAWTHGTGANLLYNPGSGTVAVRTSGVDRPVRTFGWASPPADGRLVMQDDGNAVIYKSFDVVGERWEIYTWASNTQWC